VKANERSRSDDDGEDLRGRTKTAPLSPIVEGDALLAAIIYLTQPLRCYAKFMIVIQPNPLQEPRHPPIRGCGGTARRK
jgi:hypothetical protein